MKSARQLDADIAAALAKPRRSHLSKVSPRLSPKDQFVDLLMQRTDEAREIARDLLLEHGVIRRGRVESIRTIGDSFSGPIYQLTMNVGGKRGVRYWTVGPSSGYDIPTVGSTVDFMTTKGYPPNSSPPWRDKAAKENAPKEQFHRYGGFEGDFPEFIIRKWIDKWWK